MTILRFSKKLIVCLLILIWCFESTTTKAQKIDSVPKPAFDSVIKLTDSLRKKDSLNKVIQKSKDSTAAAIDSIRRSVTLAKCGCVPNNTSQVISFGDWCLVFLPFVIFVILFIYLLNSKGLKDFSLKEALSENMYPTIRVDNPQYNSANLSNATLAGKEKLGEIIPPTIEKTYLIASDSGAPPNVVTKHTPPPPNPSISRYIAFITSILTLVIVLGVTCFYIYHYIRTGCPPELTGISTLLIALGIGILPYIFNKASSALGKSKDDSF